MNKLEPGDVVQITAQDHDLYGCLAVIRHVTHYASRAEIKIPYKGIAEVRLKRGCFKRVGKEYKELH